MDKSTNNFEAFWKKLNVPVTILYGEHPKVGVKFIKDVA